MAYDLRQDSQIWRVPLYLRLKSWKGGVYQAPSGVLSTKIVSKKKSGYGEDKTPYIEGEIGCCWRQRSTEPHIMKLQDDISIISSSHNYTSYMIDNFIITSI